jgi:crystallin, alpha B
MSLLPSLLEDLRPARVYDRLMGLNTPNDIISDVFNRPSRLRRLRPWTFASGDVGSTITNDEDKFQVNLEVKHFNPEEIKVTTADGYILVEGKHEERENEFGYVSREFNRRYILPEDCSVESVECKFSSGMLIITAPRSGLKNEPAVPIKSRLARRKLQEDKEEEVKPPNKKRRR